MSCSSSRQRGSVIFYILIAIVAFAALSFAVSRSGRESATTINREKADLGSTELLDYVSTLRSSIQNMTIQGVRQNQLCFDTPGYGTTFQYAACSSTKNMVFNNNGGNAPTPHQVTTSLLNSAMSTMPNFGLWYFPDTIQVKGVGKDCPSDPDCNEIMTTLAPLSDAVCKNVNNKLGIASPEIIPVNATTVNYAPYLGLFVHDSVISSAVLDTKRAGCFRNTDGSNVFYAVLIAN